MAVYDEERRGSSQSILGALLNPISQIKYQYFSAWAIPTYWSMMTRGSFAWSPFYFISRITGLGAKAKPLFGIGTGAKVTPSLRGLLFKWFEIPTISNIAEEITTRTSQDVAMKSRFVKGIKDFIAQKRLRKVTSRSLYETLTKYGWKGTKAEMGIPKWLVSRVAAARTVSTIGSVLLPIAIGAKGGELFGNMLGLAFKGAVAAMDYVDAEIQHMRALEFGGTLGPGFRAGAAATERQRAMQALQRTPLAGRRFLGQEASMYSNLI